MNLKFLTLTEELCHELRSKGYVYMSIFSAYDEDAVYSEKTVILKPHKAKPKSYLIALEHDDIHTLMAQDSYKYCVICEEND